MATLKPEGIWPCTVISGKSIEDDKGRALAQITVRIDEGPATDVRCTYEDEQTGKSALYTARSMKAVGWRGEDPDTLEADIVAWIKATGGKTTVEIKHLEIKRGSKAGQIWDKASSIGRTDARQGKPQSAATKEDAKRALREAMAADTLASTYDDAGAGYGTPSGAVDDVPF
jgi:hypothetical protein